MKTAWQRFVRLLGDDPETAGIGLLLAIFIVAAPMVVLIYFVVAGHYEVAGALALGLAAAAAAVIRDSRRGRWSFVSVILAALWLLLLALWATSDFWGPYVRR